jgi:hypothetical protein
MAEERAECGSVTVVGRGEPRFESVNGEKAVEESVERI